ncbi:MAG: histidine kinase [Flavobacteriales bacterium]|jgi:signal transduction histidine kinase|nr:histidine kinase [Flavobacteriales bacterium]
MDHTSVATVLVLSALVLVLVVGAVILLLIVVHQRRIRHRAEIAELAAKHVNEIRQAEREVEAQTLRKVGEELHDNVGQLLTSLGLDIQLMREHINSHERFHRMVDTLDQAVREIRRLSASLNTDHLRTRPLQHLLRAACEQLDLPGRRSVQFITSDSPIDVSPDDKVVLFRIFQEATNNALKHARATRITVALVNNPRLRLTITDNGSGFNTASVSDGQGLANIRRRATLIGAVASVYSDPANGTIITISR